MFRNGVLEIDKAGIRLEPNITKTGKLIDRDNMVDADYVEDPEYENCMVVDFLNKSIAVKGDERDKVMGYLCYDYKDQTEASIVAFMEESEARFGGGSGKGVTCQALNHWTRVKTVDGEMVNKKDLLLQSWKNEPLLHLNDIPKRFNIATLKALAAEGTERKVLYKNIETVGPEDMPKMILSGQFGLNTFDDGGVGRRVVILPFTNYFNKDHTPIMEYGGKIPDVWSETDWRRFYVYIANCIHKYLKDRRLRLSDKVRDGSWDKNFDYAYNAGGAELREWIEDKVTGVWTKMEHVTNEELQDQYDKFCRSQNIKNDMRIKRLHEAIGGWCQRHGYVYEHGKVIRDGDKTKRVIQVREKSKEEEKGYPELWDELGGEMKEVKGVAEGGATQEDVVSGDVQDIDTEGVRGDDGINDGFWDDL